MEDRHGFTGFVVTFNESRRLSHCLESLQWCDQLIVVDLGSKDDSIDIAERWKAEVIHHRRVPVVEEIRRKAPKFSRHNWIVFLDPDEVFPRGSAHLIRRVAYSDGKIGGIVLPWVFYVKEKPLGCTIWGGTHSTMRVVHRDRVHFADYVHRGIELREGYRSENLSIEEVGHIRHFWVDSYAEMFRKHWRYVKKEGEAKFVRGYRFTWRRWIYETIEAARHNLVECHGLQGGARGLFLSLFYAWYVSMGFLSLGIYQKYRKTGHRR
jgi:glycosyltransferase involved in cell wall biosynthesis